MRWLRNLVLALVCLAVLGAGAAGAGWWWLQRYMASPGPLAEPAVVLIERGSGLAAIAAQLEEAGAIESALVFRLAARVIRRDRGLKAGEYELEPGMSPEEIIEHLERGQVLLHPLTVPEGLTTTEVMALVEAAPFLAGDMPEPPGEGTLLPETYLFARGTTREQAIATMRSALDEAVQAAWEARQEDLPLESPSDLLILASIIEKETAIEAEYGLVASVFVNRLRKGMPLQTDPTVIYAITGGKGPLGRQLLRKDLKTESPYNTYLNPGLPPGPIANPGRKALMAAVNPEKSDYLYFVADGSGGHAFARSLKEHNRNAARWRKLRDQAD